MHSGEDLNRGQVPQVAGKGYAVGYGKPPAEHRFAKGKSGNPKGRPPRTTAPSDRQ